MPALTKYISSDYLAALNALAPRTKKRKVLVYVESYEDVFFWRAILTLVEDNTLTFVVTLPSYHQKIERGKKAALIAALRESVGPYMIACVDADYDYLRQGTTTLSQLLISSPYVFHTYAYSMENLQCWGPGLHDVCVMATLNDAPTMVDSAAFLAAYSRIIYPLFVWNILCCRNSDYGKFDITDFLNVIKTGEIGKHSIERALLRVQQKVQQRLRRLDNTASAKAKKAYAELDKEMRQLGVTPDETYLYIQGHHLFNGVVVPLLSAVCNDLKVRREREIYAQSKHETQRKNELTCYERAVEDIRAMLKKNTAYLRTTQVARILDDLRQYIASIPPAATTPPAP